MILFFRDVEHFSVLCKRKQVRQINELIIGQITATNDSSNNKINYIQIIFEHPWKEKKNLRFDILKGNLTAK